MKVFSDEARLKMWLKGYAFVYAGMAVVAGVVAMYTVITAFAG